MKLEYYLTTRHKLFELMSNEGKLAGFGSLWFTLCISFNEEGALVKRYEDIHSLHAESGPEKLS